jgi:hypothetical protein
MLACIVISVDIHACMRNRHDTTVLMLAWILNSVDIYIHACATDTTQQPRLSLALIFAHTHGDTHTHTHMYVCTISGCKGV